MTMFYNYAGHALVFINLLGMMLAVFPQYREKKLKFLKEQGYYLWQDQLVSAAEIAVGVMLISL